MSFPKYSQKHEITENPVYKKNQEKPKRDAFLKYTMILGITFFFFSLVQLNIDYIGLLTGFTEFFSMIGRMFPPDVSEWKYVLAAGVESLQVAILGTVIAIVISLVLSFLGAENITPYRLLSAVIKGFASLMRVIPTIVWALIFIVAVGLGPLAGVLAIAIHSLGMLIKMFSQSVEEIDSGIIEAMRASGATWIQMVAQGVVPTVFTALLSWSILRLEIDIGESTILGLIGAGGIGFELARAMRSYNLDQAFFVASVIFVMIFSVELLFNRLKLKV